MTVVTTLERFLLEVHKAGKNVNFVGITGNHDRFSSDKTEDVQRS